jgi:hypothetical protein
MHLFLAVLFLIAGIKTSASQTMSFTESIGRLATACGPDVSKHCKGAELGGGQAPR